MKTPTISDTDAAIESLFTSLPDGLCIRMDCPDFSIEILEYEDDAPADLASAIRAKHEKAIAAIERFARAQPELSPECSIEIIIDSDGFALIAYGNGASYDVPVPKGQNCFTAAYAANVQFLNAKARQ